MRSRAPPTHFMDIYIDDCVIVTASYATHVRALKRFLEACRAERMYVNQKAILGYKSITYVGYSVSYDGVSADPDKVSVPRRIGTIYYSRFVISSKIVTVSRRTNNSNLHRRDSRGFSTPSQE